MLSLPWLNFSPAVVLEAQTPHFLALMSPFRWISGVKTLWCTWTHSYISNQYSIVGMKPQSESTTKQFYDLTYSCVVATINQADSNNCKHYVAASDVTHQRSQRHIQPVCLGLNWELLCITNNIITSYRFQCCG